MVISRKTLGLLAIIVAGSLTVACTAADSQPKNSPTEHTETTSVSAPVINKTSDPSWRTISETTIYRDAFEAGVLIKSEPIAPPVPITETWENSTSRDGTIWYENTVRKPSVDKNGDRLDADILTPKETIEFDPITGKTRSWGLELYQGKGNPKTGAAGTGSITATKDHVIWTPRLESFTLFEDDYDIWVMNRDGSNKRKIGESTIDTKYEGRDISIGTLGPGSDPIIVGNTGYWVESVSQPGSTPQKLRTGMSIFSAPLDGSEPMKETIPGGWTIEPDLCAPQESPSFTYVISTPSSGNETQKSEVRRRTFNQAGDMVSDEQIWEADAPSDIADSVSACGDSLAVGRYALNVDPESADSHQSRLDIVHNGEKITFAWKELDYVMGAVRTTPYGVFFRDEMMGGFYFDFEKDELFHLGEGDQVMSSAPSYRPEGQTTIMWWGTQKDPEYIEPIWENYLPIVVSHGSSK